MKLYNNSQKTPQSESLHKVKQNWKTPHQKNEGIHSKYNRQQARRHCERYGRKKTPRTVLQDYRENFHTQNTQAGS